MAAARQTSTVTLRQKRLQLQKCLLTVGATVSRASWSCICYSWHTPRGSGGITCPTTATAAEAWKPAAWQLTRHRHQCCSWHWKPKRAECKASSEP